MNSRTLRGATGLAVAFAVCCSAGDARGQRARMTDATPFVAAAALTPPYDEPLGWIGPGRYVLFAVPERAEDGVRPTFFSVDARTGDRTTLLDRTRLDAALVAVGAAEASLSGSLSRASDFVWSDGYARLVVMLRDDLYLYDVESGAARRLTADGEPEAGARFSSDGRRLAFRARSNVFVVDLTDPAARPEQVTFDGDGEDILVGELDPVHREEVWGQRSEDGLWWSPDGRFLALLRFDEFDVPRHSIVEGFGPAPRVVRLPYPTAGAANPRVDLGWIDVDAVLEGAATVDATTWVDRPRNELDSTLVVRVGWHPTSDELWFQVQDRSQTWLEMRAVAAVSDDGGSPRLVFREESDCWVENGPEPFWLGGGEEFLWLSERDGFEHVYRYATSGELLQRVTRGAFDVERILAVDEATGRLWFATDRTDPSQLHVWRCALEDGGAMAQVTSGRGWHEVRVDPSFELFLDDWSAFDVRRAHRVHDLATGGVVRTLVESDMSLLDPFGLSPPEFVDVPTRDGFSMRAILVKPPDYEEGTRYPVLCHVYSGPHAPRALDRWRDRDYLWHQLMAQRGHLIWICDNRSASGRGRGVAKACHHRFGTEAMRDLEDGVRHLVDAGYADPDRVGIWGWSFGGYQALYCLTHSDVWSVGAAINPVTDWRLYDSIYTERYLGSPTEYGEAYDRASVVAAASSLRGPVFLAHATDDANVHVQHSLALVAALQRAGKDFRFVPYPRASHRAFDRRQQEHLFRSMAEFFRDKL